MTPIEIQTDIPSETYRRISLNGTVRVGALKLRLCDNGTLMDEQGQQPPWKWFPISWSRIAPWRR